MKLSLDNICCPAENQFEAELETPRLNSSSRDMSEGDEVMMDFDTGNGVVVDSKDTLETRDSDSSDEMESPRQSRGLAERAAIRISRRPRLWLGSVVAVSIVVSLLGLLLGDFQIVVDNAGWQSRGTLIADRQSQFLLIFRNRHRLFNDRNGKWWDELINNVQPGWEQQGVGLRRRLENGDASTMASKLGFNFDQPKHKIQERRSLPFPLTDDMKRKLQLMGNNTNFFACDRDWYGSRMVVDTHLWPIWKVRDTSEPNILLNKHAFRDLCRAEERTQQILIDNDLCYGCDGGCLPPYSIILYARLTLTRGAFLNCDDLAEAWGSYINSNQASEDQFVQCAKDMRDTYQPLRDGDQLPASCPTFFSATLIDEGYAESATLQYTSSIFATKGERDRNSILRLYDRAGDFDRGTRLIEGAYDTQYEDFVQIYVNDALIWDIVLAIGSGIVTSIAILIHTRSPFLTVVGLAQILLSFPLAYFFYAVVAGLEFFPFLNFIGIFVVFALGADDIFVSVDKWKNARILLGQDASTDEVAAKALPDAAYSMFLTSITTAVAFFATSVGSVAPITCFSVFCGLLVMMDYFMCVLMVFPAICIYDKRRHEANCLCRCSGCHGTTEQEERERENETKQSLIHKILSTYYEGLHKARFIVMAIAIAAFVVSCIFASKIDLPVSSDVRLLNTDNQFEINYQRRFNILHDSLIRQSGSSVFVMWGVKPADTGDQLNPASFTQLVLDESFDPSKTEAQIYLRDFCDKLFATEYAQPADDSPCPINSFDQWLQQQTMLERPTREYARFCAGASGLPMNEADFHSCLYNWGQLTGERFILARNGKIQIMMLRFQGRVHYRSPYEVIGDEWDSIETWMSHEREIYAPQSLGNMYFTSSDYWWYDTNGRMLNTAYVAASIALATAAFVILISSRSIVLTILSVATISYVLASVTAVLVALGWTLGL